MKEQWRIEAVGQGLPWLRQVNAICAAGWGLKFIDGGRAYFRTIVTNDEAAAALQEGEGE